MIFFQNESENENAAQVAIAGKPLSSAKSAKKRRHIWTPCTRAGSIYDVISLASNRDYGGFCSDSEERSESNPFSL